MEENLLTDVPEEIVEDLKRSYEDYLAKAEEPVLTFEEFNLHIFQLGILSNEIKKKNIELDSKKSELSEVKSELFKLEDEYKKHRKIIKTLYSYE